MGAAYVSAFGPADAVVNFGLRPRPKLSPGSGQLLVRVLACSTSPGDWRTYQGDVDMFRSPADLGGFPYVPSGDVCGIVEAVDPASDGAGARFAVGDCIVGTWAGTPLGGMAEYALLDVELTAPKPAGLSPAEAAALPNSSLHALDALREAEVRPGERVLVLGGGGGVGTALLQLLKNEANAGFVATTASAPQAELLASLGADRVIDYTKEAWSASPEFVSNPFDIVIDCAEGLSGWEAAKRSRGVKRGGEGGRFIAVSSDDPHMQIHNAAQLAAFSATTLLREPASRVRAADWPRYHMYLGGATPASLAEVCALAEAGRLRVVLDPAGPFPFTTEGLRAAYNLQASFHAHGKVVVEIEPQG